MTSNVLPFPKDRRKNRRFPLSLSFRFTSGKQEGTGRTLNMSSRGLLAVTSIPLRAGQAVTASVDWPAELDGTPLQLILSTHVLRSKACVAAMEVSRYEFRTRGRAAILHQAPIVLFREAA